MYDSHVNIPRKVVPCAECGANPGQPCVSSTGKERKGYHVARSRVATRLYMAEKEKKEHGGH